MTGCAPCPVWCVRHLNAFITWLGLAGPELAKLRRDTQGHTHIHGTRKQPPGIREDDNSVRLETGTAVQMFSVVNYRRFKGLGVSTAVLSPFPPNPSSRSASSGRRLRECGRHGRVFDLRSQVRGRELHAQAHRPRSVEHGQRRARDEREPVLHLCRQGICARVVGL